MYSVEQNKVQCESIRIQRPESYSRTLYGLFLLQRWDNRDVEAPVREGVSEPSGPGPSQTLFLKAKME